MWKGRRLDPARTRLTFPAGTGQKIPARRIQWAAENDREQQRQAAGLLPLVGILLLKSASLIHNEPNPNPAAPFSQNPLSTTFLAGDEGMRGKRNCSAT